MNSTPAYEALLTHVLKRIPLTHDQQNRFRESLRVKHLLPRQHLLYQGEICNYESYVFTGFLRAFHTDNNGIDHTLSFAMEDWWISDFASFFQRAPSSKSIVTLTRSILVQISKDDLEKLYEEIPVFERFWRILHQEFCVAQDQRILNSISMNGSERYEALIKKYPTIEQRLPQKHIASFLGITPVFLSQIRKTYSKAHKLV
jgi:CRP-like cAMP-binding protein